MSESAKRLYKELRGLSKEQLWGAEVARFDAASPEERKERVAVIRAVGVAFAEAGTVEEKARVREWLRGLLRDRDEKVRRYAMAAMPKLGAGAKEEGEMAGEAVNRCFVFAPIRIIRGFNVVFWDKKEKGRTTGPAFSHTALENKVPANGVTIADPPVPRMSPILVTRGT